MCAEAPPVYCMSYEYMAPEFIVDSRALAMCFITSTTRLRY